MKGKNFDSFWWGMIPAVLLPLLLLFLFWLIGSDKSLGDFLESSWKLRVLSKELSLANIPNLLLFFIYIWTERDRSARGVISAVLLYTFLMLIMKII